MTKKSNSSVKAKPVVVSHEKRPVTMDDHWCRFLYVDDKDEQAPYGYVVTITPPQEGSLNLDWLTGYVVRVKKSNGNLLLQVVLMRKRGRHYSLICYKREVRKKIRGKIRLAKRRIINIVS